VDQAGGQPFMDREDIVIPSADIVIPSADIVIPSADIVIPSADIVIPSADIVILSAAKNLRLTFGKILRCAQDDCR
jgi:hypothetical protein